MKSVTHISIIFSLFLAYPAIAQKPTITIFSPTSGPIATTVTITGTNFSSTPANNIVYFGATRATVTAATPTQLTVTVPVGATYQPVTVQVNGFTGYSSKPFITTFTGGGTINACSFASKVDFTTGTYPVVAAVCDFDGDGKADLAMANGNSNNVSVFRNTSTGVGIINYASKIDFASGTNPPSIATGDVDGDGKPDMIVVNRISNTVSVFRNTSSGTGVISYAAKIDFTTGSDPFSVSVTDMDGDGLIDVVVANLIGNTVSVLRNTSTGVGNINFAAKIDFNTGTTPYTMSVRDLDGDGKPDIVSVNNSSNTVSVFLNTSTGAGNISYASKIDFATGVGPFSISIGDLDGDDKADLAVTNRTDGTISIFRNTSSGAGNINYAPKVDVISGTDPIWVSIGDLDGDGKADLAVANFNNASVSILRNLSSGAGNISFATRVDFITGSSPRSVAIGDFDGDGKPDLIVANATSNTFSAFLNTIGNIPPPTLTSFSPASGPIGTTVTINGTNFSSTPANNLVKFNGTTAVVTVSSATSITTTVPTGATTGLIQVTIGCNTVTSATNFIVPVLPTITSFTPTNGPIGTTVTITGTNFTATPANNIVYFGATRATVTAATPTQLTVTAPLGATYQPISVLVNGLTAYSSKPFVVTFADGGVIDACSFDTKADVTTGSEPYSIAIGDLDNDGKPDLVVANKVSNTVSVLKNISILGSITPGSFAAKVDFITNLKPYYVGIHDLDGDGKPELIVSNNDSDNVSIFKNTTTTGVINASSFAAKVDFATGENPWNVAIDDFDLDGKPDLAVVNDVSNTVSVLRNQTTTGSINTASFTPAVNFATGAFPIGIDSKDLDGDGKSDLVITNQTDNSISIFQNTSTVGSITAGSFVKIFNLSTGLDPYSVSIGDLNNNGKPDVVVANLSSGSLSVFDNISTVGSIALSSKVDFTSGAGTLDVKLSDMDGDGKPDAVVTNGGSRISILKNANSSTPIAIGSLSFLIDFTSTSNPYGVAIGDLDGNGKPDIAATNYTGSSVSILRNKVSSLPMFLGSSITPMSGPVGAVVTFTGTNYSSTPLNNTITFNGVPALVTASSSTSITAIVPVGATTGPITIEIGCVKAISVFPFIVTAGNTITITSQPAFTYACEGSTATFTVDAAGTTNITYKWQKYDGTIFADINDGSEYSGTTTKNLNINTAVTGFSGNGQYRCRINGDGAPEVISNAAQLTINGLPSPPDVIDVTRCGTGTVILTASGGSPGTYRWYTTSPPTLISGETNATYTTPPLTVNTSYSVSLKDSFCESIPISISAIITSPPTKPSISSSITAIGNAVTVCSSSTLTLSAPVGFDEYFWSTGATTQQITVGSSGNYTVTVSNAPGCTSPASDALVVTVLPAPCNNSAPVINTISVTTTIGGQTSINLLDLISDADNNLVLSSLIVLIQPTSGAATSINNGILSIDYTGVNFTGTDQLTIQVCDVFGECAQQQLEIKVIGDIEIYNAVSPNNDDKNEIFRIKYIDLIPETQNNKVTIYNRWGSKVFEVENYNNDDRVFKGLNDNGNELPSGTYFYKIFFPSTSKSETGYLVLKR